MEVAERRRRVAKAASDNIVAAMPYREDTQSAQSYRVVECESRFNGTICKLSALYYPPNWRFAASSGAWGGVLEASGPT